MPAFSNEVPYFLHLSLGRLALVDAAAVPPFVQAVVRVGVPARPTAGPYRGSLRLDLWLRELVLAHKVLHEVVAAVAGMIAVWQVTRPSLELAVAFILVAHPVSLALEGLRLRATGEGASERLHILMHVLRPIRWLMELLHFAA